MKMIEAIIQPDALPKVKAALKEKAINKMTVFPVKGCGMQMGYTESYKGQTHEVNLLPKICLRIAVNEDFVDTTIDVIVKSAQSGEIGDGKIFVLPMEQCIRIRTNERGEDAIG